MLHAEREFSRKFSRKYHWSPALSKAVKTLHYWQLWLRLARGHTFNKQKINRLHQELNISLELSQIPIARIVEHLRASKRTLKEFQQRHIDLREEHLKSLSEARVLAQNPSLLLPRNHKQLEKQAIKEIQQIEKIEALRVVHSRINQALHPAQCIGGLPSIDIPSNEETRPYPIGPDPKTWDGPWDTVTDPKKLAEQVCAANARQYHQASYSPF